MTRTALIASLTASLALTACSGSEPEEAQAGEEATETSETGTDAGTTPDAPKTDAEGNEIVSEGPGQLYGAPAGSGASSDAANVRSASANTTSAPVRTATGGAPSTAQSGSATPAGARPSPGSKLQKADPQ
jgi:hypothetical protein